MKSNVRIFLISFTALVLIISFQNCAQEEGLAPGIDSAWNSIPPPSAEPTPPLSKEGAQCTAPTYYGAKNCSAPANSFMYKDMPVDGYGMAYPTTVVVPDGCTLMIVKVWGAGGGSASSGSPYGGAGAIVSGTIPVGPGEVFNVIVGEGGKPGGSATFGGGGAAGTINGIPAAGASGGGRSAIQRGYYDIVTAGGGGGASAHTFGGYAGVNPFVGGANGLALSGGAATNGDATTVAKAGTAGTNSNLNGGNGTAGSRFQGGNGGNGNPGSGGGGGGYFGGGGGASSGMQSPSSNQNYASGGGGGASYIGCGNLKVSGVDMTSTSYLPTAPERIPGFNAPPLAGAFSSCDTPSRPGGISNSGITCQGQTKGSDGFIYIEWR